MPHTILEYLTLTKGNEVLGHTDLLILVHILLEVSNLQGKEVRTRERREVSFRLRRQAGRFRCPRPG